VLSSDCLFIKRRFGAAPGGGKNGSGSCAPLACRVVGTVLGGGGIILEILLRGFMFSGTILIGKLCSA
jgi:hypothetical protein